MPRQEAWWVISALLINFTANLTILNLINNEKFKYPNRMAIGLNGLYLFIFGGAIFYMFGFLGAIIASFPSLIFAGIIVAIITPRRDKKGLKFGQRMISILHTIDIELNSVLYNVYCHESKEKIYDQVYRAVSLIIDEVIFVFGLDENDHSHISLLLANDRGYFEVYQVRGISDLRKNKIEGLFRWQTPVCGVAGRAAMLGKIIYIPDISKGDGEYVDDWVSTERGQKREGALICIPMMKGVGDEAKLPLGVLTVTSEIVHAFDDRIFPDYLQQFATKIENLLYIRGTYD